jgi:2-haloacid dehalogenase
MLSIRAPRENMDKPLLIFDVNETLIDLRPIGAVLERIFGESLITRLWYADMILYAEALTLADAYVPFTDLGLTVLRMLATADGIPLSDADEQAFSEAFSAMAPYPEVPAALRRLRDAGFRLFTLTNSPSEVQQQQFERSGILQYFERCFSIDSVRRYKPAREAYVSIEQALATPPTGLMLVACHAWDTLGARTSGWRAVLIKRPGNAAFGAGPQPEFIGSDLREVAEQLALRCASEASLTK